MSSVALPVTQTNIEVLQTPRKEVDAEYIFFEQMYVEAGKSRDELSELRYFGFGRRIFTERQKENRNM